MKDTKTITRRTMVKNELGMHARPAAKIAQIAQTARSSIWIYANSIKVDAQSIIDILTLGAVKGTMIVIEIENKEDMMILEQILEFFETGFGEM